jgi:hypothetical protein
MSNEVTYHRYSASEARTRRADVERIYASSYVEAIASGNPFDTVDAFMRRFDSYVASDTFAIVVAYAGDEPIGQAWGWPLRKNSAWWDGLQLDEPDQTFAEEDGKRTFALSEIMVNTRWTGQGIAHNLHNVLLVSRNESRGTLLVEPTNERARRTYLRWGWRKVGQLRPRWEHAPLFEVMILPLPIAGRQEPDPARALHALRTVVAEVAGELHRRGLADLAERLEGAAS